jgi:6,7-dimethyl-8-ribityllumazine synthase
MHMTTLNLSEYDISVIPSAEEMRFGLIVSEWNRDITESLLSGAHAALKRHGAVDQNITVVHVPGSFELPSGAQFLACTGKFDAIILLGCIIRGETSHYDHICMGVTQGTMDLNLKYIIPFIFGVLTTESLEQARDRAGGRFGNKGEEAAITAIKMVALKKKIL